MIILNLIAGAVMSTITVTSPAFKDSGNIPAKYTCEGQNINPEINLANVPKGAVTLVLIMDDPDAPMEGGFTHWVMYNMKPTKTIKENSAPETQGLNGKKEAKYIGPCPPTGNHHYHFKVFALDKKLDVKGDATKDVIEKAMKGHILATGELIGLYEKKGKATSK